MSGVGWLLDDNLLSLRDFGYCVMIFMNACIVTVGDQLLLRDFGF
jgi:hypothetical protein